MPVSVLGYYFSHHLYTLYRYLSLCPYNPLSDESLLSQQPTLSWKSLDEDGLQPWLGRTSTTSQLGECTDGGLKGHLGPVVTMMPLPPLVGVDSCVEAIPVLQRLHGYCVVQCSVAHLPSGELKGVCTGVSPWGRS